LVDQANSPDTVGEIHVPAGGSGQYTYTVGATTSIEVSADGGSWSSSGSVKTTKTSSADSGWNVGAGFANQLQSFWRFNKYQLTGYCPPEQTIKVSSWLGGATVGVGVGQWDGACLTNYALWTVSYDAGTFLVKTSGAAFHYAIGAMAFGLSLYSESEWTSQNRFQIDFAQPALMCGNDAPIPSSSLVYKQ
jgi:hypothetical protein